MITRSGFRRDERAVSGHPSWGSEPRPEKKFRVIRDVARVARFQFCRPKARGEARAKIEEHLAYLRRMAAEAVVPPELAFRAKVVWHIAWISLDGELTVPAAVALTGGPVGYSWERGPHQISVEIPVRGSCHWFYRNKTTRKVWGGENAADDELSPRVVHYLRRLVASAR